MKDLIVVKVEDLHQCLTSWIKANRVVIGDYEDMKEMVMKMIRAGHCFSMDRDRLRDAMEDIAFMMNAEDDALKDRVLRSLEYEDEESDEDDAGGFEEFVKSQKTGPTTSVAHGPDCKRAPKKADETEKADATDEAVATGDTDEAVSTDETDKADKVETTDTKSESSEAAE